MSHLPRGDYDMRMDEIEHDASSMERKQLLTLELIVELLLDIRDQHADKE